MRLSNTTELDDERISCGSGGSDPTLSPARFAHSVESRELNVCYERDWRELSVCYERDWRELNVGYERLMRELKVCYVAPPSENGGCAL